eukprot:gene4548-5146_t
MNFSTIKKDKPLCGNEMEVDAFESQSSGENSDVCEFSNLDFETSESSVSCGNEMMDFHCQFSSSDSSENKEWLFLPKMIVMIAMITMIVLIPLCVLSLILQKFLKSIERASSEGFQSRAESEQQDTASVKGPESPTLKLSSNKANLFGYFQRREKTNSIAESRSLKPQEKEKLTTSSKGKEAHGFEEQNNITNKAVSPENVDYS